MLNSTVRAALAAGLLCACAAGQAASVYLTPSTMDTSTSSGIVTFELFADFSDIATIGGGIDLDFTGTIGYSDFRPTDFFLGLDQYLTGFGTADADADVEIHFGGFGGITGVNKLGDLDGELLGAGPRAILMAINQNFGDFFPTSEGPPIPVNLVGVSAVPLPATAWMLLTGIGAIAGRQLHRRKRAIA